MDNQQPATCSLQLQRVSCNQFILFSSPKLGYNCRTISIAFYCVWEVDMSIYQQILNSAQGWPEWQQDALRRIVQANSELTPEDIEEIAELCKKDQGWPGITLSPQPIAASHLPSQSATVQSVCLTKLHSNQNVCATVDNQELAFAQEGLSVFYGDNGSGKSSYTKVLKQLCSARGNIDVVQGNAFNGVSIAPHATIEYSIDGKPQQPIVWKNGVHAPDYTLSRISVFDNQSAQVYIGKRNEPAYTPAGLDLLPKLAAVCGQVQSTHQEELARCNVILDNGLPEGIKQNTAVGKLLAGLAANTDLKKVQVLAGISTDEENALKKLKNKLAELRKANPKIEAQAIEQFARRCTTLCQRMEQVDKLFGIDAMAAIHSKLDTYHSKQKAAKAAKERYAFDDDGQLLKGVGANVWKSLWQAAKAYSLETAYPDQPFPAVKDGARCVLCHQELATEASQKRLELFESFVQDNTQKQEAQAKEAILAACKSMLNSRIRESGDDDLLAEVEGYSPDLAAILKAFLNTAISNKKAIAELEQAIEGGKSSAISATEKLPDDALSNLKQWLADMRVKADELKQKDNEEEQQSVAQLMNELEAKDILGKKYRVVERYIKALKNKQLLEEAIRSTRTSSISRASTTIAQQGITEPLRQAFEAELKSLGVQSIQPTIQAGSERGKIKHEITLANNSGSGGDPRLILSEGEHRIVALAAFFAELDPADTSGILFDDPVCSLDHKFRDKVAKRLVMEARKRQVLIFSHDILFLYAIDYYARALKFGQYPQQYVERRTKLCGCCHEGFPFKGKTTAKRIGELNNYFQDLSAKRRKEELTQKQYEYQAANFYGCLRRTWERAVEEVLFNAVIERFKKEVSTQMLRNVTVTHDDYEAINDGMTKCSKFLNGHEIAPADNAAMPEPDELREDLDALKNWRQGVLDRRK